MSISFETSASPVPGAPVYRRDQSTHCKKLVVGIHGMGDQMRNGFIQNIAELFARYHPTPTQATRLPLGLWDAGGDDPVEDHAIGFVPAGKDKWLQPYAFAELHWAHLPRLLERGHRLEDPTVWPKSIVDRLGQRHNLNAEFHETGLRIAATVVEEIGTTIRVLDRLLAIFRIIGKFEFDLKRVVECSLCDVQQVAEYQGQRWKFLKYFFHRMEALSKRCPGAEIHFVAHSEGSALAFYALLSALRNETAPRGIDLSWIERVHSFSTLGSPIDKHLILFPEMWYLFSSKTTWRPLSHKIRWRNYCDCADPVGFDLDTARLQLKAWGCDAFEFRPEDDQVFRRYLFPGKAHGDYFRDDELFKHLIENAIEPRTSTVPKLRNRWFGSISLTIPLAIAAAIHVAAVVAIAIAGGSFAPGGKELCELLSGAALLFGTTVLARTLRLTQKLGIVVAAVVFYGITVLFFNIEADSFAGRYFVGASISLVVIALAVDYCAIKRRRRPIGGLRAMTLLGAVVILVWLLLKLSFPTADKLPMLREFVGAVAFYYLWWLGALVYDMAYCWTRYVNSENDLVTRVRKLIRPSAPDPDGVDSAETFEQELG